MDNIDVEINIPYFMEGCCGPSLPFDHDNMIHTPYQIYNKGVTDDDWQTYVQKLNKGVNRIRSGCCPSLSVCILSLLLPPLIPLYCRSNGRMLKKWDDALRNWQKEFNENVLVSLGMYVKTFSNCYVTYNEEGMYAELEAVILSTHVRHNVHFGDD